MVSELSGHQRGAQSTSKRTRTNDRATEEEEEDADLDLQQQDRKRMQQGRKGRVMTDGYDSDSTVEDNDDSDEEAKESEKDEQRDQGNDVDGDDEDMFNLPPDEQEGAAEKKGKKKKYLDLKDIEGQEFGGTLSDDDDRDRELELESDLEEYSSKNDTDHQSHDAGAMVQPLQRRKKPSKKQMVDGEDMGFELDSFNMKNEMATGRFDTEGNYIENLAKDPHAQHDSWLTGHYSRKSIQAAREAQAKREKENRERERKQEKKFIDEDECKMQLVSLMKRSETVLGALQRLGKEAKKSKARTGKNKNTEKDQGSNGGQPLPAQGGQEGSIKESLDQVTALSSELMSRHGLMSIYDETYESLVQDVRKSGLVRQTWDPAASKEQESNRDTGLQVGDAPSKFRYKWSPHYLAASEGEGMSSEQVFGPFTEQELRKWKEDGYFGSDGENILVSSDDASTHWQSWNDMFVSS